MDKEREPEEGSPPDGGSQNVVYGKRLLEWIIYRFGSDGKDHGAKIKCAKALKIRESQISRYITGKTSPALDTVGKFVDAGLRSEWLFEGKLPMDKKDIVVPEEIETLNWDTVEGRKVIEVVAKELTEQMKKRGYGKTP